MFAVSIWGDAKISDLKVPCQKITLQKFSLKFTEGGAEYLHNYQLSVANL